MPASRHTLAYADEHRGVVVVLDDTAVWIYRPPGAAAARGTRGRA